MVVDDVSYALTTARIIAESHVHRTATEAHIAYHNIVGVHLHRLSRHHDSIARRRLTEDTDVRSHHMNGPFEVYLACHIEYYDARTAGFACLTQRSRTGICQTCHDENPASTASERVFSAAFSAGKSRNVSLGKFLRLGAPRHKSLAMQHSVHHFGQRFLPCGIVEAVPYRLHSLAALLHAVRDCRVLGE